MNALLPALLLTCVPLLALGAASGDPMDSPECRAARAELEQELNAPGARVNQQLERSRRRARDVCLGRAEANRQRSGAPDPVQAVPPPVLSAPRLASLPAPAAPPPAVAIPRPTSITACDPAGCWDSQGHRLNQMGPVLMGPHGQCSLQGGVVICP